MFRLFLISLLVYSSAAFSADKYVCTVDKKTICSDGVCKSMALEPDDYRIVDVRARTYQMGSDIVDLNGIRQSGIFNYFLIGASSFMKVVTTDIEDYRDTRGSFVEVRDTFLSIITSYGVCKF